MHKRFKEPTITDEVGAETWFTFGFVFPVKDARKLESEVVSGGTVDAGPPGFVIATMYRDEANYVLEGLTGKHTLAINVTDAERLAAHWTGFVAAQVARHQKDYPPRAVAHS